MRIPYIAHAEIGIGDSKIWLAEENEQWGNLSPQTLGGRDPLSAVVSITWKSQQ